MAQRDVVSSASALVNALRAMIQASNSSTQQNVVSSRDNLRKKLTATPSDSFSPTWREVLREIGGENLFGAKLLARIETAIDQNQMTPAVALSELEQIVTELQQFSEQLERGASAFAHFMIGSEKLAPGECEIGILIPRNAVKNELLDFATELRKLGSILNTFSEVATGKTDELEVRAISTSEFLVFLSANASYAACVAVAIERVVTLYKQLLEIRKLHQEIRKQGVPEAATSGIAEHANTLMADGIEKAAADLVEKFYKGNDGGRKHELVIAVRLRMNEIANRIDKGFNLEVRCEPFSKQATAEEEKETQTAIATIQAATPYMQFLKLEGQPLLQLPESSDGQPAPDGAKEPRTEAKASKGKGTPKASAHSAKEPS